jgi:hypothetical protein
MEVLKRPRCWRRLDFDEMEVDSKPERKKKKKRKIINHKALKLVDKVNKEDLNPYHLSQFEYIVKEKLNLPQDPFILALYWVKGVYLCEFETFASPLVEKEHLPDLKEIVTDLFLIPKMDHTKMACDTLGKSD